MRQSLSGASGTSRRIQSLAIAIVLSTQFSGCATLVEGSAQTVRVETDPPGARCVITRNGTVVSEIPSTPATISLAKEKGDLAMRCSKRGYLDSGLEQSAEFSGTVFGNILFGGLIGAVIDMGSGATHKYPERIWLSLVPERFDSVEARDEFFAQQVRSTSDARRKAFDQQQEKCADQDCTRQLELLNKAYDERLRTLERQRQEALIASPSATQ